MNGQKALSKKERRRKKRIQTEYRKYLKRVDIYHGITPYDYNFDIKAYSRYLEENNIPTKDVTPELCEKFKIRI